MSKTTAQFFPVGAERESAINQAKFLIPLKLLALEHQAGSQLVLQNDANFKEFINNLNLHEIYIGNGVPTILFGKSSFESALHRAKQEGWIQTRKLIEDHAGIYDFSKKYYLNISDKGRRVVHQELDKWIESSTKNGVALSKELILRRALSNELFHLF